MTAQKCDYCDNNGVGYSRTIAGKLIKRMVLCEEHKHKWNG